MLLMTLAAGQFLMAHDSSVMNVSIAAVAEGLGTTVTGIQSAITLYPLVMASLIGAGSLITSLAPNLLVLLLGWSLLEGIGAALIMPAIVALIAATVGRSAWMGLSPVIWMVLRGAGLTAGERHRPCRSR